MLALREIIKKRIKHTPRLETRRSLIGETTVPPLGPTLGKERTAKQIAEAEALTQEKKLFDYELDKIEEQIKNQQNELADLDPASPTYANDIAIKKKVIADMRKTKRQQAARVSDALSRILRIEELRKRIGNRICSRFNV